MSKRIKIMIVIAISLILLGIIIFLGAIAMSGWNFKKLFASKYETNNYEINENFNNISIVANTADITLAPSENSQCSVVCYDRENMKHTVTVKDDTLVIEVVDSRKWYEHISINFDNSKITVYVPQGEYAKLTLKASTGNVDISNKFKFESIDVSVSTGDVKCNASTVELLKIKTSTGDINIENVSAGAINLSVTTGRVSVSNATIGGDLTVGVSTGKAYLTDITCKNVTSSGSTGDVSLKNVIATEKFSIERSTGDVKFDGCDAAEIFVKTDTGDVTGTLLSEKVFITRSNTGDIDVPKTITGGKCEIATNTGDIRIIVLE